MTSSVPKRMTESQRTLVKATLATAFDEGEQFESVTSLQDFLKKYLAESLISSNIGEIFDCYLGQQKANRDRQLLSPSLSDGSQLNCSETSPDADDSSEKSDSGSLVFASEDDPFPISFFRAYTNTLTIANARICKGSVSYVSERFAGRHFLKVQNQSIILPWSAVGKYQWASTRCELMHPDQMLKCDVALAENHGTQDEEDTEEELDNERPATGSQSNDLVLRRSQDATIFDGLSPEQELSVAELAAMMNATTATRLVKRRAPLPPPPPCGSDSYGSGPQQKRSRIC